MFVDQAFLCRFVLGFLAVVPIVQGASDDEPEAARLSDAIFRQGLQERGLTDLLEFYLSEYPPADAIDALLLRRELKLAQHADATRSEEERRAALQSADEILLHLVRQYPEDLRRLDWRLEYIRSMVHRHAEPHCLRILYGSGTDEDRERVLQKAGRGLEEIGYLMSGVQKELERLDKMSVRDYERLEARGYIDKVEQMQPQADYLRWWATFYLALARAETDPYREGELRQLLKELREPNGALATPHETSHVQAQAQLLAGMSLRLLHDYDQAVVLLNSAIATVSTIPDPGERQSLQWVVTLAMLERVRALRDSHAFDAALDRLEDFREHVGLNAAGDFQINLLIGLLERSIWREQAKRAERTGNTEQAQRYRDRAADALEGLADENSAYRDEVYAALFDQLSADDEIDSLPPIEKCALLAGLLRRAAELQSRITALSQGQAAATSEDRDALVDQRAQVLDRAIRLAQMVLSGPDPIPARYRPEVLFNLAVAHYHRGQRREAAERFLEIGRDFPQFGRAEMAALNAVQLASELYRDPTLRGRKEVQTLYLGALRTVTTRYGHADAARYWQFFFAQTLEELGRLPEAAAEYARVHEGHENYFEALAAAVRCWTEAVKRQAASPGPDAERIRRSAVEVTAAVGRLSDAVAKALPDAQDVKTLRRLEARALADAGEVYILPGVDQPETALAVLDGYTDRFPGEKVLIGRVLRVRVIALEAVGRLGEAEAVIPRYVHSDPVNAGATLQGLFDSIREEIDRLDAAGRREDADAKARSALMLARQIREWAVERDPPLPSASLYAVDLQLAESYLRSGEVETALELFGRCLDLDSERNGGLPTDQRAISGRAEALFRVGRYEEAMPLFNRIVRGTSDRPRTWWRSLLRDLQCRTELGAEPSGILKVIRQHRVLDSSMGGPRLREQFDALERVNEQRLASDA